MKDSIFGNSKIFVVINLSPSISNRNETTSSLQFAERLKKVKLEVVKQRSTTPTPKYSKLQSELEFEKMRRMDLERKLQSYSRYSPSKDDNFQDELNKCKSENVKLEQTLDKLLLFSCKNIEGNHILNEFNDNNIVKSKVKKLQSEELKSPYSKSPTPNASPMINRKPPLSSGKKVKRQVLNDSLNFDYNELDNILKAHCVDYSNNSFAKGDEN